MRVDPSSLAVVAAAVLSALVAAWGLDRAGLRGQAMAASLSGRPVAAPAAGSAAQVLKAADGHYWAEARIEAEGHGRAVRVMVDTGASLVALTREDAARLGLKLRPADFSAVVDTASGPVRAAPVRLDAVAVAGARVPGVDAVVLERGLPHSLLGMSYLGRLAAFSATPAALTLRP